jgi:hypothetical protein
MVLAYAGLFAALALVGLACWKWPVGAERWYAYKYEKTQKAEYRGKLEKLGEEHPELLLSWWFHLVKDYGHPDEFAAIPLSVRRKGTGLFLGERLKGDWWKEKCSPSALPDFPSPRKREEWEPHVGLLREAMRRVDKPPSSTGAAIYLFYDMCLALALCGDDAGLPYLEDNLFNDAGYFPYAPDAITDCLQGPPGVVALAAHGNERAREDVLKGLQRLRRREEVAYRIEKALKAGEGCRPENLNWLRVTLAEYRKQRAAEKAAAEARYRELAAEINRSSCAACAVENRYFDYPLHGCRLVCNDGSPAAEMVKVHWQFTWSLWREPLPSGEYAAFWQDLLEFDLWNLPGESSFSRGPGRGLGGFRAGGKQRQFRRDEVEFPCRYPDEPATWVGPLVEERLQDKKTFLTGTFGRKLSNEELAGLVARWLRGEPWEEIVKVAASAAAPEAPSPNRP